MASFNIAYNKTMGHEGGYAHDPDDVGGETYKGIARRYHAAWAGWDIVDRLKKQIGFPKNLNFHDELQLEVKKLYKLLYWDSMLCDSIVNQHIANELFDTGVNMGITRAQKYLQQGLNYLNKNERLYADIVEDGKIGEQTLNTLRTYLHRDNPSYLLKIMNILQGVHYLNYMKKSPSQEKFARGWLNRVQINK